MSAATQSIPVDLFRVWLQDRRRLDFQSINEAGATDGFSPRSVKVRRRGFGQAKRRLHIIRTESFNERPHRLTRRRRLLNSRKGERALHK